MSVLGQWWLCSDSSGTIAGMKWWKSFKTTFALTQCTRQLDMTFNWPQLQVVTGNGYGEGYPVSWCLSNREDQIPLTYYFEHLKNRTRTISPKWFMSDDFDRFYIMHGYQYSIDIYKKPMFMACGCGWIGA